MLPFRSDTLYTRAGSVIQLLCRGQAFRLHREMQKVISKLTYFFSICIPSADHIPLFKQHRHLYITFSIHSSAVIAPQGHFVAASGSGARRRSRRGNPFSLIHLHQSRPLIQRIQRSPPTATALRTFHQIVLTFGSHHLRFIISAGKTKYFHK